MRQLLIVFILLLSTSLFSQNSINESLDTTKVKDTVAKNNQILDAVKFKRSTARLRKMTTLEAVYTIEYVAGESLLLNYPKIDFLITHFSDKNFNNSIIGLTMGSAFGYNPTLAARVGAAIWVIDCFKIGATMVKYKNPETSLQATFTSGFGMLLPFYFSLPTNVKLLFTKNHFSVGTEIGFSLNTGLEDWDDFYFSPKGSIICGLRF